MKFKILIVLKFLIVTTITVKDTSKQNYIALSHTQND